MAIRIVKRVSENYILDPDMGLYYNLRPVKKTTTDAKLLEDIDAMVAECVAAEQGKAGKVYRPCAYLLPSQINAIDADVVDRASENTYLMLFDPKCAKPSTFAVAPWSQIDAHVFTWSSDDAVYTWCTPDGLSMRFQTVTEAEALADAFETADEDDSEDDSTDDDSSDGNSTGTTPGTILHLYCPHCGEKIF